MKRPKKKRYPRLKTDERPRHELQTFKVRCSLETVFYAFVEAHNANEAEIMAENWCKDVDWDYEATYKHSTFEAGEA